MELFEFRGEDITADEDGGIIRRIITKGQGYSKPNEGAAVEGNAARLSSCLDKHLRNSHANKEMQLFFQGPLKHKSIARQKSIV